MILTKEAVETRLEHLRASLNDAVVKREDAIKLVLALDGAVQDCEWFLSQFPPELIAVPDESKNE